ncbi:hypothetical protein SAMN06265375_104104 [Muriicola jejuensis]|uniref:Uncharacterized protein n=1 Tax=Muriicola jejuensis TaxID=504488 RepID=A0A6P0UDJ2_9FLAO|nr:hypothetical protein [Muriicola jejuensis]NER11117.1 hypothetical protein [Muriicola jejuensis]SMP23823.1 hypothetical protein SAMN06265375_104104 [Muriicola jejuensis]
MKKTIFLLAMTLCYAAGFANCTNAYASAGYSLSHAKKSMEANNFEHQQYYAERALSALEKARDENETCGCPKAGDPILNGIENLKTALSQDKWDNGRYFTKRALEDVEKVLYNLDMCALDEEPQQSAAPQESLTLSGSGPSMDDESPNSEEWDTKLSIRQTAEDELANIQKSIEKLAAVFECERARQIVMDRKTKTDEDLQAESVYSIRSFYMSQVVALHNKALFALLECSKK